MPSALRRSGLSRVSDSTVYAPIAAKCRDQSSTGPRPTVATICGTKSGALNIWPDMVAASPRNCTTSWRNGFSVDSPRPCMTSKLVDSSLLMNCASGVSPGRTLIAFCSIQAPLSPGLYALMRARSALERASQETASVTAAVRRLMWRVSAPKPPKDSGLWMPDASPTCRMRSQPGCNGELRNVGKKPNTRRCTSRSSSSTPWYSGISRQ
mmetsp:Transcript_14435/g.36541  ORF Transcript_14435/g.36541 Transcript_14435/m.36541 type:complete len:210 (+) Transcript_14435:329-958(+)